MAPNQPQYPCTAMAPQGSSTLITRSLKRTPAQTRTPAKAPIMTDAVGETNGAGRGNCYQTGEHSVTSHGDIGLSKTEVPKHHRRWPPATAARLVLTAITEMRRSVAASVEPGLNPIQPNKRMKVPVTTNTMLWAGNARCLPSDPYLPVRGPRIMSSAIAHQPPVPLTTAYPAKSQEPS